MLTAAHCVTQLPSGFSLASVRLGEHDLAADPDCARGEPRECSPAPQEMEVEEVVFHPNYSDPKPFQNDIAVIKLEDEAEFQCKRKTIWPACLPTQARQRTGNGQTQPD